VVTLELSSAVDPDVATTLGRSVAQLVIDRAKQDGSQ